MRPTIAFSALALLAATALAAPPSDEPAAIARDFLSASDADAAALRGRLLGSDATLDVIAAGLRAGLRRADPAPAGWSDRTVEGPDGRTRPWALFVPEKGGDGPRPLLLDLHGGVSRPEAPTAERLRQREEGFWSAWAAEHGVVIACPSGDADAPWWTATATENLRRILAQVKRLVDIDERRVIATGFSDGASGCFHLAVVDRSPFAAFLPLNGHPGVAAAGGLQVHLANLLDRPMAAINTDRDSLYPATRMAPIFAAVKALGAPVTWRAIEGFGHEPSYLATERAPLGDWMLARRRPDAPETVHWAGTAGAPSRVDWVDAVEVGGPFSKPVLPDPIPLLPPGRVRLGIQADPAFAGPGVRIAAVVDDSAAAAAGLRDGDVLVGMQGKDLADLGGLRDVLGTLDHGDAFTLRVRRDGEDLALEGAFPAASPRPLYTRDAPWGSLVATRDGDRFDLRTDGVTAVVLRLPWVEGADPARPVRVVVNGIAVHDAPVADDPAVLLDTARADLDRTRLVRARLRIEVPERVTEDD